MIKTGIKDFRVSTVLVDGYSGTSDFNTDAVDFSEYSKSWIVYLESTHTTGTPTITMQVSQNGTDWIDYDSRTVLLSVPAVIEESKFYPLFMRLSYVANSSDGLVTFKYNQINE